jgi:hypothetical protein
VSKGDSVCCRTRFGGLAKDEAEAASIFLKRADIDCLSQELIGVRATY